MVTKRKIKNRVVNGRRQKGYYTYLKLWNKLPYGAKPPGKWHNLRLRRAGKLKNPVSGNYVPRQACTHCKDKSYYSATAKAPRKKTKKKTTKKVASVRRRATKKPKKKPKKKSKKKSKKKKLKRRKFLFVSQLGILRRVKNLTT